LTQLVSIQLLVLGTGLKGGVEWESEKD
jgi:hypothetical protein